MLKTPAFWYKDTAPPIGLVPLAYLYDTVSRLRRALQRKQQVTQPVICIGNATMGGSGKTPVAISIHKILANLGYTPHFLSRGYGGSLTGPLHVNREQHTAAQVGDEPLLLAKHAPCCVAKNKTRGAAYAIEAGADCILLDDGFQNPSLHKDISFLVIDAKRHFGNGAIFPAGPLREKLKPALQRASACILLGGKAAQKQDVLHLLSSHGYDKPVFFADIQTDTSLKGQKYVGFSGIGLPQKFHASLTKAGAEVKEFYPYPDHYAYTANDLAKLENAAQKHNAALITTEKDFVRLPASAQKTIKTLPISLQWQDQEAITAFLQQQLEHIQRG